MPKQMYDAKQIQTPLYNITREFKVKTPNIKAIEKAATDLMNNSSDIYADLKIYIEDIISNLKNGTNVSIEKSLEAINAKSEEIFTKAWDTVQQ